MLLTIPWCVFMYVRSESCFTILFFFSSILFTNFRMYSIYERYENPYLSTFLGEIIGLSVLWLFWIVGTAIASVSDLVRIGTKYSY